MVNYETLNEEGVLRQGKIGMAGIGLLLGKIPLQAQKDFWPQLGLDQDRIKSAVIAFCFAEWEWTYKEWKAEK